MKSTEDARKTGKIINFAGRAWSVTYTGLRKQIRSTSFSVTVFLALLFWYLFVWNLKSVSAAVGYGIPPYLLPHFFASGTFSTYGLLLIVLANCGAPWLDDSRLFSITRSGRMAWCAGQILFIVLSNILLQVVLLVTEVIALIPCFSLSDNWGSVLYTMAVDPSLAASYSGYGSVNTQIVSDMSAIQATGMQMLLCIAFGSAVGMIIFFLNGWSGKNFAAVLMAGGIFFTGLLQQLDFAYGYDLAGASPYSWMSLKSYLTEAYDFETNMIRLILIFILFAVMSLAFVYKRWIKTAEL